MPFSVSHRRFTQKLLDPLIYLYYHILHLQNIHHSSYNFEELTKSNPILNQFVFINKYGTQTIDFANEKAVFELNKAILKQHYQILEWTIPDGYLCPPIPSRADYLYYLKDLMEMENQNSKNLRQIKGLDIGVGANCIYPILASQLFNWKMVGTDIDKIAIESAKKNSSTSEKLQQNIEIRYQPSAANLLEGIIYADEYFDFTMCNPPFHSSEKEATKGTLRKLKNLDKEGNRKENKEDKENLKLNFGGKANELWCNGGEALFIKRMIKQSVDFKNQVNWFTTLVSKSENLKEIYKLLDKLKAEYKTINMEHGNKKTRIVAWKFLK